MEDQSEEEGSCGLKRRKRNELKLYEEDARQEFEEEEEENNDDK